MSKEVAAAPGEGESLENEALTGVGVQELDPEMADRLSLPRSAVVVSQVEEGSVAEAAGVRAGDVMVEINRRAIKNLDDYRKTTRALRAGESVLLLLNRNGQMLFLTISP
jgi:serine protease Do